MANKFNCIFEESLDGLDNFFFQEMFSNLCTQEVFFLMFNIMLFLFILFYCSFYVNPL